MRKPTRRRSAAAVATALLTFSLGIALAVFVSGSASAASGKKTTTKSTPKKTTTKTKTSTAMTPTTMAPTSTTQGPASQFFVVNGTVNAASDHEIVGSSAFPNFTTGAVDNYYSKAHSHVDNSPFAEGTASPADTGPVGQTAAAGNFQQPQYADARWPGGPDKAEYGNQGGPYATAAAGEYQATADASEATNGLSGPGLNGLPTLALPKGFDALLQQALGAWKAKWLPRLSPTPRPPAPKLPAPTAPVKAPQAPKVTAPKVTTPKVPTPKVTAPKAAPVTKAPAVPVATVTAPTNSSASPPPPVTAPTPTVPSTDATDGLRSLQSASSKPKDGESLLSSSTLATVLPGKTGTLVTSGESSLGRVSIGGGQIVIEGIHVTASITNDGAPSYKAAISVGSASIGGIPVTIDEDGVHIAGQGQGLPYQQASDALNGALKQAGIQLFLVAPEVKTSSSCGQSGTGTGTTGGSTTTTGTTTTTSTTSTTTTSDQSGTTSSCDQSGATCGQSGGGTGPIPTTIPSPTSTDQSGTSSCDQMTTSCDQGATGGTSTGPTPTTPSTSTTTTTSSGDQPGTSSCDETGTSCDQTAATGTSTTPTTTASTTTTSGGDQSGATSAPSWCDQFGAPPTVGSSCGPASTTTGTTPTTSTDQSTTTTSPADPFGFGMGGPSSTEETVTATGVHVVFTQPVNQSGVPAQFVEHILGEVFVDSLAVPAGPLPNIDLSTSSSSFSASACGVTGRSSGTASSGTSAAGGTSATGGGGSSSAGGSTASGSLSQSGSGVGSTPQPTSGSTGNSLPAVLALALRKPLWLLLAYVLWQALVVGTGASLWNWKRGGTP